MQNALVLTQEILINPELYHFLGLQQPRQTLTTQ